MALLNGRLMTPICFRVKHVLKKKVPHFKKFGVAEKLD